MTTLIAFLLLAMPGITFTVAQEGRVPKETCQLLKFDLRHRFINDPNFEIEKLSPNRETLEVLRRFITSEKRCSIATDIQVFEITYDNTPDGGIPTYTETIKIQVSANRTIAKSTDRVTSLRFCFDDVIDAVGVDTNFENSLRLNVSGKLEGGSPIKRITVVRESCCHVIYGFPVSINQCCKPGFLEDGDNCACPKGEFLNKTSCDACPEDTYQPNPKSSRCLSCPNRTTTYGKTGADSRLFCLRACLPGQSYNLTLQKCETCPKNTYQPQEGKLNCIPCQANTITKNTGSTRREDCVQYCSAGSFHNFTANKCENCPLNSYQPKPGQTACIACRDGSITLNVSTVREQDCIKVCPPGSYFNKTFLNCTSCERRTYQPDPGSSQCIRCSSTHTTFEMGSTNINDCVKACPPGSHHVSRTDQCSLCNKDSFQSDWGQERCEKCGNDTMAFQEGSTKKKECFAVCRPGEYHDNMTGKCDPCARNTYQPSQRQFSCNDCPDGTLTQRDRSTSFNDCLWDCDKGFYQNSTSNTCIECPIGTYKDITGHTGCVGCRPGYTTLTKGSVNVTQCILDAEESSGENLKLIVAIPVVLTVLVLSACLLVICFYRRWRKENERRMSARPLDPRRRTFTDPEMAERPKLNSVASMPNHHYKMKGAGLRPDDLRPSIRIANIPKELEIPRENLKFVGQVLGKGNFGKVEKAILLKDDRTENVVAVKMIKGGGTFSDEKELFDELEMLACLYPHPHPNIVNLVGGCTTSNGPLFVVVECCGEGNLLKYLQKNQLQAKPKQEYVNILPKAEKPGIKYEWKLQKALEICHGMAHLAKFKIIHRDVAARNVLLDENWVAKISDFGMARDIYVKQIYRKDTEGFLPVRWMAIESLESFIYTTHSDVWSFGILLWEIISDGRVPYNNILDHTQLLNYIKSGRIMKRPKNCPKDLYHIMEKCWAKNPSERPAFESLKDALELLHENEVHKDYALPQRILRKFSSRRKKRQNEEDVENPGGKTRAKKTLSNSSGKKIAKIEEEEPNAKKGGKPEEDAIKMEIFDPAKETVNNEFENQGYQKSDSSTSEEHDTSEKSQKASNENTFELDTISETPVSRQNEEIQDDSHDNTEDYKEITLSDSAEISTLSLQHEIENELKAPIESGENDGSSSIADEFTDASKRPRMFSTDC